MLRRPGPDIGNLDMRALRAFVEVADIGHFGQAANNLSVSPSALSRSIKVLEDWSGVVLLIRTARRADLTPAGQSLLPLARTWLQDMLRFREAATLAASGRRGVLNIGFMDVAIADFLPAAVARHRRENPDVEIRLIYGWREQQHRALIEGELDVAFTVGRLADQGIASTLHKTYRLMLVVPADHPLANRKDVGLGDLADQPFVFGVRSEWQSLREIVDRLCAEAGFQPRVAEEVPSRDALFGFVAAGLGVTLYPAIHALMPRPGLSAIPLAGGSSGLDVHLSHRRNPPPMVAHFVAGLTQG